MTKKVIIIGAGPAGLTAAYELLKNSDLYEVHIFEESSDVGGISKTVKYKKNRMDIGGHRFFSKDERVMEWWKQMMPLQGSPSYDDKKLGRIKSMMEEGPDPEKEDRVMLIRQRVSRIYYRNKFFDYPISMKMQTFLNMGFFQTVKAGCSYLSSVFHKKKETSLENFYINRFGKVLYSMFFEGYTEKLWGRHPREISAEWGAQRVKGLSIRAVLKDMLSGIFLKNKQREKETSLIEEFIYPKYGPGQLWEYVADEVIKMGGCLHLNCKVISVKGNENSVSSVTYYDENQNEHVFEGEYFVSTMPVKDLIEGFEDDVPEHIKNIGCGLPYRDFVTIGLYLDKLNLINLTKIKTLNNIIPDCWIYVQDEGVKLGRIQIFNNWSPYMVEDVENKVWIGLEYFCSEGDEFWNLSDEDSTTFAIQELIKMGVIESMDNVLDSHRERVKKAYPAYFDTYGQIADLIEWLNKYQNLFCIGRNGQHRYNNMDHSMVTAMEAVKNIMNASIIKDNIWEVNTEKQYHEKK